MSTFVATIEGEYVNLDLVSYAKPVNTRDGHRETVLFAAAGNALGRCYGHPDFESLTAPVMPAEPGTVVIIISISSEGRPGSDDVFIRRMPVIAWRVGPMSPVTPVCIEEIAESEAWFLPLPSGELLYQDDQIFGSIERAADNCLLRAQVAWDGRRLKSA